MNRLDSIRFLAEIESNREDREVHSGHEKSQFHNYKMFPHVTQMARDVFAVPATGAGVERQFSKSGRIATWARALLHPDTVRDIMMYKDYLSRTGKPLTHGRHGLEIYDDGDSKDRDEDPEESAKMIEREKEMVAKN